MTSASSAVWHPFTQHAIVDLPLPSVVRTGGAWLETSDGRRIFDGISSWWVTTHGHRHPRIVAAIREAADRIDQVIFANLTHEAAESLAAKLVAMAPPGLTRAFFSDSGSTAVEVALKMALGFWYNRGEARTRIIALEHGYHGDTVGAMSAGARGVFTDAYSPFLFEVARVPFPAAGSEQAALDALEAQCRKRDAAAFIVEPLILGAGGMLVYPARVLTAMRDICRRHGVLFIADEVMTGWGRTGTLFACTQADIAPDIMCLAKGITGGAMPLAVTLASDEIFAAHFSKDRTRTFFHSSSYTANPIACAAALANLEVWANEPVLQRLATIGTLQQAAAVRLSSDRSFVNVRYSGTILALDLAVGDTGYLASAGPRLQAEFLRRDVLLRPLGNTVYVMPPYCSTGAELDAVYAAIADVAHLTLSQATP